ncbi:hypothetical protein [Nitrosarchaeum sp.]|uniref:hypothetical protein n=1 Tax=Nitrosarchaeum sp. TaxID=2026886 RepID=UPI00247BA179|nr:hypothetical protein [Nitrosarchaeum sp.]MCV0412701.1 hypothetical protein [Nitrosarchaeum sp.]
MKIKLSIIIILALIFASLPSLSFGQLMNSVNDFNFDKQGCELIIFDQWQPTVEGREWAKKILDECIKRGFITQELADMAPDLEGYGTASVSTAYKFANGDILKTIKILQDPNFPNNIQGSNNESLQKGETLGNVSNTFGWFVLAMSLFIVFAYIVMKIKRRKNEN